MTRHEWRSLHLSPEALADSDNHLVVPLFPEDIAGFCRIPVATASRMLRAGDFGSTIRLGRRRAILKNTFLQGLEAMESETVAAAPAIRGESGTNETPRPPAKHTIAAHVFNALKAAQGTFVAESRLPGRNSRAAIRTLRSLGHSIDTPSSARQKDEEVPEAATGYRLN